MTIQISVRTDWTNTGSLAPSSGVARLLGGSAIDPYDEVGDDVRQTPPLTITYGRDQAREYSPPAAGKMTYDLDNTDGKYSSLNSSSPLFGYLNPGLLGNCRIIKDGVAYQVFEGYRDAPNERPGIRQQVVSETFFDALAKLKAAVISTSELVGVTIDVAIGACLDAAGWSASLRDISTADTTLTRWCVDRIDAFTAIRDLTYSEGPGANFYVNPLTGKFTWENRHYRLLTSRCTSSQMTAEAQGAEPIFAQDFAFDPGVRNIVNSCTVPVNAYTLAALGAIWTGPTPIAIAAGQTYQIEVSTVADWFTAAVAPTVGGGDYTLAGTAPTSVTLSRTSGKRAVLTIIQPATGGCTISNLRVRAQAVTIARAYYSNTISGASASGVDYGTRTFPEEFVPSWVPDADSAIDFDNYVVGRYKDPVPTCRFMLRGVSEARIAYALPRRVSDRITIVEPLRSFINSDFFVEQITWVISQGGTIDVIFGCEQASSQGAWVLGVAGFSELDVTTRVGF